MNIRDLHFSHTHERRIFRYPVSLRDVWLAEGRVRTDWTMAITGRGRRRAWREVWIVKLRGLSLYRGRRDLTVLFESKAEALEAGKRVQTRHAKRAARAKAAK